MSRFNLIRGRERAFPIAPLFLFCAVSETAVVFPQVNNQVISAGYVNTIPAPQVVAPGQVITLFVRGINVPDAAAAGLPLPTSLSGVSVGVTKLMHADLAPDLLPTFKIHSEDLCAGRLAVTCPATQITVQVPTEAFCMSTVANGCDFVPEAALILNVKVNGVAGQDYPLSVYGSVPHLLNSCDTVASAGPFCNDLVTHGDGSLVTAGSPAQPGETIVIYADGLGRTAALVPTGTAASAATPTIATFPLAVSYRKEGPGAVVYFNTGQVRSPVYSGLTPNFVGLYQINVVVPPPAGQTHNCAVNGFADTNTQLSLGKESVNIRVSLAP